MKDFKDWWDDLPKETQVEIDQALKELDKGKGVSHEKIEKNSRNLPSMVQQIIRKMEYLAIS